MCPDNAACRGNRAAALIGLRRLGEAAKECEEALRIDPSYGRAHHRLASLHISMDSDLLRRSQLKKKRENCLHNVSTIRI
uniref:Uncharacterized protein n=1 Tax=Arundo donax TaxID=35708 RepID=A0A0A9CWH3_ARUDO